MPGSIYLLFFTLVSSQPPCLLEVRLSKIYLALVIVLSTLETAILSSLMEGGLQFTVVRQVGQRLLSATYLSVSFKSLLLASRDPDSQPPTPTRRSSHPAPSLDMRYSRFVHISESGVDAIIYGSMREWHGSVFEIFSFKNAFPGQRLK